MPFSSKNVLSDIFSAITLPVLFDLIVTPSDTAFPEIKVPLCVVLEFTNTFDNKLTSFGYPTYINISLSPLSPLGPRAPMSPLSPLGPWIPWGPCAPLSPLSPFKVASHSDFVPLYPLSTAIWYALLPASPWGPWGPC